VAGEIFEKQSVLKPTAMRTVAERRFDDAQALAHTNENARANGTAYLAGFVIEILLKAQLVERFKQISSKRPHELLDSEREVWSLIWRSHDLEAMLNRMPQLEAAIQKRGEQASVDYVRILRSICATWTIQARYSPYMIVMEEALEMLEKVRTLKEVLK
jgi:hypothetical protein